MKLIYQQSGVTRFTQDSPVLPDVWFAFGERPNGRVDLLLNPHINSSPGEIAHAIEDRLAVNKKSKKIREFRCDDDGGHEMAYNQSTVVARLCFHELVRVVLPLTPWWAKYVWTNDGRELQSFLKDRAIQRELALAFDGKSNDPRVRKVNPEVLWMLKVIGTLAAAARSPNRAKPAAPIDIVRAAADLLLDFNPTPKQSRPLVWSVTRNRPAQVAVWRSTMAVKADAARRLFEIDCKDVAWAVIDSGIDAQHPAFRLRDEKGEADSNPLKTRVAATYDFTLIRYLLTPELPAKVRPSQKKCLDKARRKLKDHPEGVKQLRRSLQSGREVDWELLKPLIEVPHDKDYFAPTNAHGTHVAGILAADWHTDDKDAQIDHPFKGVCPDIKLYDLRVLDDDGTGDEFSVIAAMQFVRYLNLHKDLMLIQGINLSLSIKHDVANYACGRTPVCEEASRLVGAGVVVVAAAGNQGYLYFLTASGSEEGYRSISITDPGNTEGVITVGATHRESPHTFGVSYFSSRGPTGDGRLKPDLVAPGEKIVSTIPLGDNKRMDGTSMAAPHVSGVAALLLARYPELVGQPDRIKEILCKTATDLGRERYFQGAGMVDALRAIQSV